MKINFDEIADARLYDFKQKLVLKLKDGESTLEIYSPMSKSFYDGSNKYDENEQAEYRELVRKVMEHCKANGA